MVKLRLFEKNLRNGFLHMAGGCVGGILGQEISWPKKERCAGGRELLGAAAQWSGLTRVRAFGVGPRSLAVVAK